MDQPANWTALTDAALERIRGKSDREGARLLGLSSATVNRWRELRGRGAEIPEPRGTVRAALLRSIDRNGSLGTNGNRSDEVSERLAAGESPGVLAMMYEARAAVLRAEAAVVEANAAQVRAEALRAAELGAYARAAATAPEGAVTAAEMLSSARAYERELARGTPPADEGAPLAATG